MNEIEKMRMGYLGEIVSKIAVMSQRLQLAFSKVPKEKFLGSGPWKIFDFKTMTYSQTEDDDPRHLYHDVLIAIDEKRYLNNGMPSALAAWINSLQIKKGERVLHIGAGLGYYTAIMAEMVGPEGEITGLELDPALAGRAQENLDTYPNTRILEEDGSKYQGGKFDAIFVNAGATHPLLGWLASINKDGRLLLPITAEFAPNRAFGFMLRIEVNEDLHKAEIVGPVGIYNCAGARNEKVNDQLKAFFNPESKPVEPPADTFFLKTEKHEKTDSCYLHTDLFCLSIDPEIN